MCKNWDYMSFTSVCNGNWRTGSKWLLKELKERVRKDHYMKKTPLYHKNDPTLSPSSSVGQNDNICSICKKEWAVKSILFWVKCTVCSSWLHRKCDPYLKPMKVWRQVQKPRASYPCPTCRTPKWWKYTIIDFLEIHGVCCIIRWQLLAVFHAFDYTHHHHMMFERCMPHTSRIITNTEHFHLLRLDMDLGWTSGGHLLSAFALAQYNSGNGIS